MHSGRRRVPGSGGGVARDAVAGERRGEPPSWPARQAKTFREELMRTEGSLVARYVAFLTPLFSTAAGYLATVIDDLTGAHLDGAQLTCLIFTSATSATAASWKWLTGWQQHESLVANGLVEPRRSAVATARRGGPRSYARARHGITLVTEMPPGTTAPRSPGSRT
jgi:hypothetical protein